MLASLNMIQITSDGRVLVKTIGRQYFEYWNLDKIGEQLRKYGPMLVEAFISSIPALVSLAGVFFGGGATASGPERTEPKTARPDSNTTGGDESQLPID
jgi:hypothetical protein